MNRKNVTLKAERHEDMRQREQVMESRETQKRRLTERDIVNLVNTSFKASLIQFFLSKRLKMHTFRSGILTFLRGACPSTPLASSVFGLLYCLFFKVHSIALCQPYLIGVEALFATAK